MSSGATGARRPPSAAGRSVCYKARDAFYACVDGAAGGGGDAAVPQECATLREAFEASCMASWVRRVARPPAPPSAGPFGVPRVFVAACVFGPLGLCFTGVGASKLRFTWAAHLLRGRLGCRAAVHAHAVLMPRCVINAIL